MPVTPTFEINSVSDKNHGIVVEAFDLISFSVGGKPNIWRV